jgi:hypothetical protein
MAAVGAMAVIATFAPSSITVAQCPVTLYSVPCSSVLIFALVNNKLP